ncbi:hypothetical protein AB3K78_03700 [Leucobacter sp. HNU]|uniref:hypothetical protein n=1 Tax=Leucobacter sp. HNU TaxID=3236805 RepID=UPI003A8127CF
MTARSKRRFPMKHQGHRVSNHTSAVIPACVPAGPGSGSFADAVIPSGTSQSPSAFPGYSTLSEIV